MMFIAYFNVSSPQYVEALQRERKRFWSAVSFFVSMYIVPMCPRIYLCMVNFELKIT